MFSCPHCGNTINLEPSPEAPWYRYDPGPTRASLGCGTLILIAIIVAIFSGDDESDEIRALRQEIKALEQKIDASLAARPVEARAEENNE